VAKTGSEAKAVPNCKTVAYKKCNAGARVRLIFFYFVYCDIGELTMNDEEVAKVKNLLSLWSLEEAGIAVFIGE